MKITKFGHCCLLIEEKGVRVLTDPGNYTDAQNEVKNINVVLITHEHVDHFHTESIKKILENNPEAKIITNSGVAKKLEEIDIKKYSIIEGRNSTNINGIKIEAYEGKHEEIFKEMGQVQNTGYLINDYLFYPGDSFNNPQRQIDVLALPTSGGWCRTPDSIRYALSVKPRKVFPVHDGGLNEKGSVSNKRVPSIVFEENSIEFINLEIGVETEI